MACFIVDSPTVGALEAVISISDGVADFRNNKSTYYDLYSATTDAEITLDRGLVPFAVMFQGFNSVPSADIVSYDWRILDTDGITVLQTMKSKNAAHVFDAVGTYTAELTVTHSNTSTHVSTRTVEVMPRTGTTYYVDAMAGDDTNDGLTEGTAWRTATKAFHEMSPYTINAGAGNELSIADITSSTEVVAARNYSAGTFIKYRSSAGRFKQMLKQPNGEAEPKFDVTLHTFNGSGVTVFNDGDQVLFKRGQTFKCLSNINKKRDYTAVDGFITNEYTIVESSSIYNFTGTKGMHFGAYGSGNRPLIQTEGDAAGVLKPINNIFTLAFTNIDFDLEHLVANRKRPENEISKAARDVLNFGGGINTNITYYNTNLTRINQGHILQTNASASDSSEGFFLVNSNIYESNVTQIFTAGSYRNLGIVDCDLGMSGNHIAYINFTTGCIWNTLFSKPAYGRTALRVTGDKFEFPNADLSINSNTFTGWIDPRTYDQDGRQFGDGTGWNYSLVELAPNILTSGDGTYGLDDVDFLDNEISGFSTGLSLTNTRNLDILRNDIWTYGHNPNLINITEHRFASRPSSNVRIANNTLKVYDTYTNDSEISRPLHVNLYEGQLCSDLSEHTNVIFEDNVINVTTTEATLMSCYPLADNAYDAAQIKIASFLTMGNNILNTVRASQAILAITNDATGRLGAMESDTESYIPYFEGGYVVDTPTRFYNANSTELYPDVVSGMVVNAISVPQSTTTALPNATNGVAYSYFLTSTGAAVTAFKLINGTMSGLGLSLNAVTGEISGTPTGIGIIKHLKFALHNADGATVTELMDLTVVA